MKSLIRTHYVVALASLLLLSLNAPIWAGKPNKGGGGGGDTAPVPEGVIFFSGSNGPSSALLDGSDVTPGRGSKCFVSASQQRSLVFGSVTSYESGTRTLPDGRTVAISTDEIYAFDATGVEWTLFSIDSFSSRLLQGYTHGSYRWAKDDSSISLVVELWGEKDLSPGLYVVRQSLEWITDEGPAPVGSPVLFATPGLTSYGESHDFSPDGLQLAYIEDPGTGGPDEVIIRNLLTGQERSLGMGRRVSWSPTRDEVVFMDYTTFDRKVIVAATDGSSSMVVAADTRKAQVHEAWWSPDGNHLAIRQSVRPKKGTNRLGLWPVWTSKLVNSRCCMMMSTSVARGVMPTEPA